MIKRILLPGSTGTVDDRTAGSGAGGRFSEDELGALSDLARWWRHRLTRDDSADPLESHFGGVDAAGTARTVGLTPQEVSFGRPLLPTRGAALLVVALGVPDPPDVGEVYSATGLCHFYRTDAGWLSRYNTLGRAPSDATSLEIRAAIDISSGLPVIRLVGIDGLTIDWKAEAYRLEVA
ncbi:MAG: hypothetical protein KBF17_07785 [Candidatus Promineofilum sp.]|nr:hypothetical protein [Promineifilum sp.]